ncbi:MAG: hypothetical protein WBH56_06125, partial [Bacteroidota bacterium]
MPVPTNIFLFKRTNGIYYICYLQDGRRRWKSTRSRHKRDALKALTQLRDVLKEKPQDPLLSGFISDYIPYVRTSLALGTVVGYEA